VHDLDLAPLEQDGGTIIAVLVSAMPANDAALDDQRADMLAATDSDADGRRDLAAHVTDRLVISHYRSHGLAVSAGTPSDGDPATNHKQNGIGGCVGFSSARRVPE